MRTNRLSKILDYLSINGPTKINKLSKYFYVSEMTVRRDVDELISRNLVSLKTGLVMLIQPLNTKIMSHGEYFIDDAENYQLEEKNRIAKKALEFIKNNDVLMIDNGTTTEQIARMFPDNLRVTVITSNFRVAQLLMYKPLVTLIVTGGLFHNDTFMFESSEGLKLINKFRGGRVFVSCSGIHRDLGITCNKMYEIENKQAMIDSSGEKYLVVDSTKFGMIHAYHFAEITEFDYIITDSNIPSEWVKYIEEKKVKLIIV